MAGVYGEISLISGDEGHSSMPDPCEGVLITVAVMHKEVACYVCPTFLSFSSLCSPHTCPVSEAAQSSAFLFCGRCPHIPQEDKRFSSDYT